MHYRPREGERFALEFQLAPARPEIVRRRDGRVLRPARPARYAGFGAMPTSPANDMADVGHRHHLPIPEAPVLDCGVAGEYVPRMARKRRVDGSRGRYVPEQGDVARERRSTHDAEQDAAWVVAHALQAGQLVYRGRIVRVVPTGTGAIRTIPDKGAVLKWASACDLAEAIALGCPIF